MKLKLIFIPILVMSFFYIFGQTGPGGIGSSTSNILWLRSDAISGLTNGDTITTWEDVSGNGNDLSQPVTSLKPEYVTNSVNGFPVISFNVANSRLRRNPFNSFATNNITAIYVNKNNGEINDGILSYAVSGANNNFLFYNSSNIGFYRNSNVNTSVSANDNSWHIIHGSWGTSGGNVEVWKDGRKDYNNSNFNSGTAITSGGSLCLAHEQDSPDGAYASNQDHIGDFTEVIIYNTYLDTADHIIIANYLSAKYNTTLADNDFYDEDEAVNGDYDFEVAGIGQHSATAFNNDAQGSSFLRILNPSNLDNDEYMIWGHNGAVSDASNVVDIPGGVQARYERVWRVSEVNASGNAVDVGSVDVRWDLSTSGAVTASDLRLLIDTDNDGVFNDETPISGASHLGGDIYQFTAVTGLADNIRFTLATINSTATPLPISLIRFYGEPQDNRSNLLLWETESEFNNDFFTIHKSVNGYNWDILKTVKGAGNSSLSQRYQLIDNSVDAELTYYKLSQTDFDGTETEIQTISIWESVFEEKKNSVYPNPSNGYIMIKGITNKQDIAIFNSYGERVNINKITMVNNVMKVDMSNCDNGLYVFQIEKQSFKIIIDK